MELSVNGKATTGTSGDTLAALLGRYEITSASAGVAVALNDTVVPKRKWETTRLNERDNIEIIHAVQGG